MAINTVRSPSAEIDHERVPSGWKVGFHTFWPPVSAWWGSYQFNIMHALTSLLFCHLLGFAARSGIMSVSWCQDTGSKLDCTVMRLTNVVLSITAAQRSVASCGTTPSSPSRGISVWLAARVPPLVGVTVPSVGSTESVVVVGLPRPSAMADGTGCCCG